MSDQMNGLRFDVYERVHLPDDVAGIDELEEIELVPRIQVIDEGDHAVLKGQLLLSGIYRGQNDSELPLALEHWIPVEITLPMNRITRLDDISIEIDNFDVDLLSARTLNITGVLSLRGISAQPVQEPEETWREEPFTVVHQREAIEEQQAEAEAIRQAADEELSYIPEAEENPAAVEPFYSTERQLELQDEEDEEEEAAASVTISSASPDYSWTSSQLFAASPQQTETGEMEEEEDREIAAYSQPSEGEGWLTTSSPFTEALQQPPQPEDEPIRAQPEEEIAQASPFLQAQSLEEEEQEPEKQELRIAFTGKQPESDGGPAVHVGIQTLLQTSRREQAARQAAEQIVAEEQAAEDARNQAPGDEIEWKNLFLGKQSEDREFRKIRMCIVQRDETLEAIALRYSLNPREILIYNRMDESEVTEGQLLYIP
ncbi:LysM peptidoglycan-binding domain-containing protein [Paenibacillus harenae]|uniref:LysM peptidoglycan-binding domain-containing protein n=1 Tax=Paenibacillus harenae TaxID=306543 RepID=UPI00042400DF|nr:LysM peptidoglycan-binding domain-containing protein [Paenibacillus harenae]